MSVKYLYILIFAVICVAYAQSDAADRTLEAQIDRMKAKLSRAESVLGYTFLAVSVVYERFAPDNYSASADYRAMQTFVEDVLNRTREHYERVEMEARAVGVLKYTSPLLYVMGLADEGRESVVAPVRRAILGSDEFAAAMKTRCADMWTDAAETYLETFRQLSKIQETHPDEFFVIEDAKGLEAMHTPMPADSPAEILYVSEQIKAAVDAIRVRKEQLEARFKQLNIRRKDRPAAPANE